MKLLLLIICGLVLAGPGLQAGETLTLDELVRRVQTHNLVIKISGIDTKIARAEYRSQRALPNPELEYARGRATVDGVTLEPELWAIGAKWTMPNPLYRHFRLASEKKAVNSAAIEADMQKREIIKHMKDHFYKLQFYRKVRSFMDEKLRILEAVNTITKAKVSIGESKSIDYLRSSVEIQKNKTLGFKVDKMIVYERTKINELLNHTLPEDFTTAEDFNFTPLGPVESKIRERVNQSPLVRLRENHLKQETAGLTAARLSIIDGIEIFGEKEKEVEGEKWHVGIGISIPLFNQKGADIRKAKLQKEKAKTELEHTRKHFLADIQRMVAEIRVLEKEIETFKGAVLKEGKENMVLSETLYKAGEVPLMVFLDSQNSFFEVQERYYEAITEWNILKAELEALLGEAL